jgi:hypothetical protein
VYDFTDVKIKRKELFMTELCLYERIDSLPSAYCRKYAIVDKQTEINIHSVPQVHSMVVRGTELFIKNPNGKYNYKRQKGA